MSVRIAKLRRAGVRIRTEFEEMRRRYESTRLQSEPPKFLFKEVCAVYGSKNNLARYADGSAYCFTPGCGHRESPGQVPSEGVSPPRGSKRPEEIIVRGPDAYDRPVASQ